jgi:hypothetical protein
MASPSEPPGPNVIPFPARVAAAARATQGPGDPYGFVASHTKLAQAQTSFIEWSIECAAIYVEVCANSVAFAPPEQLTREAILVMLRRAAAEIRAMKSPPALPPEAPEGPVTGGVA